MGLISTGIEKVRAFELPAGIWADGKCVETPRAALVKWSAKANSSDMFYQVYVNGQYAGATIDGRQRQMIVPIPTSLESAVRIEVFAVEAEQASTDFSNELVNPPTTSERVRISLLRSQNLPSDATAEIYFDNGTGEVDYDTPLTNSPIRIWPAWQDKAGFGMSKFGVDDFGYGSAAAVGFAKGSFAHGQFGLDADTIEWVSQPLQAGVYKFGVKVINGRGNESNANATEPITVIPAARPAERLSISSFNKQTNQLALKIEDSV
ncbi:MAG TPA: hypothetical protein VMW72_16325 [Sedimentisphaerales bacterium]|nr:hypothetical protein [Sedimentisphaerales bacterium]